MFEKIKRKGFQIVTLHHAEAILTHDMPEAVRELESVLLEDRVHRGVGNPCPLLLIGIPKSVIEIQEV